MSRKPAPAPTRLGREQGVIRCSTLVPRSVRWRFSASFYSEGGVALASSNARPRVVDRVDPLRVGQAEVTGANHRRQREPRREHAERFPAARVAGFGVHRFHPVNTTTAPGAPTSADGLKRGFRLPTPPFPRAKTPTAPPVWRSSGRGPLVVRRLSACSLTRFSCALPPRLRGRRSRTRPA